MLLNRNIRLVLQLQRTDGCLISEPLSNSFHTAAVHLSCPGVAFNTAEVSVLAGTVKTFADEFFGMESSKPALLSFQYQIQQTVCFCHNSLSDHFIFHFPHLLLFLLNPDCGCTLPHCTRRAKVISETYTLGLNSC